MEKLLPSAQAKSLTGLARVKVPVQLATKVSESNEPVVGLSFLTETLAVSDPEMEPHYTCGLCNQQGQANVMLLHLRGRQHRQNWVLSQICNASDKIDLIQVALWKEAEKWDEMFEECAIHTVYSDKSCPWPPGKAPWLQENGTNVASPADEDHVNCCSEQIRLIACQTSSKAEPRS